MWVIDKDYQKAVKAYYRYCERNGFIFMQPSESASSQEGDLVKIANHGGVLATFNVRHSKLHVRK